MSDRDARERQEMAEMIAAQIKAQPSEGVYVDDYDLSETVIDGWVDMLAVADAILAAGWMSERDDLAALPWRTGRKVGRTVYAQRGPEPSDDDPLIGLMDTRELAARVVQDHNREIADAILADGWRKS